MGRVHLDHNATTRIRPEAREALIEALDRQQGNASSVHAAGRAARAMLDEARERVAGALGVLEDEVIFTSGGTESNNLALHGVLRRAEGAGRLVTTAVEHAAVLAPAEDLASDGHAVTRVAVNAEGRVDLDEIVEAAEGAGTALVSVMAANNEVGTCVDVAALADKLDRLAPAARPVLHTDAVQLLGKRPLDIQALRANLVSLSAHKVGGPIGCGVLIRRMGTHLRPLQFGGGQEADLRPGTENLPAIVAGSVAIALAVDEQEAFAARAQTQVEALWQGIRDGVTGSRVLGPPLDDPWRLPNTLNVHVEGVDGRAWVTRLDLEGLEASAGSACASGSLEPSHVLMAMGLSRDAARAGLRLSTGRTTTDEDIHSAVDIVRRTAASARKS